MKKLFTSTLMACILILTACVPAGKIRPGSDPIVVNAEQFRIEATKTLDAFIQFCDRNPALGPDVKAARDLAAKSGPVYIRELREVTRAYKGARTPANATAVESRIAALRQLLDLVRQHATPK